MKNDAAVTDTDLIELLHYITHGHTAGKVTFTLMERQRKLTYTGAGNLLEDLIQQV